MAGNDRVTVSVPRAQSAAAALEGLRNALTAHVPAVLAAASKLRALGASVPAPGSLQALEAQAGPDAAQMRAAANLAAQMQRMHPPAAGTIGTMIQLGVGWNGPGLAEAAARADAAALAQAAANPATARAVITTAALDMADHQNDTSYLQAFWSTPGVGAVVTGMASTLNHQDGTGTTLLSAADGKLLATFATSLATTVSRPGLLSGQASQQLVKAFAAPHDLWSAAMLLKYGPAGTAYGTTADGTGPKLLSGLTEALLTARAHQGYQIPGYTSPQPGVDMPSQMYNDALKVLGEWDPLTAAMQRATQNHTAATQVLNGYNPVTGKYDQQQGTAWAKQLIDPPKVSFATQVESGLRGTAAITVRVQRAFPSLGGLQYPLPSGGMNGIIFGYTNVPDSTRGAFLVGATANHTSEASAQAVVNIMAANAQVKPGTALSQNMRNAFFLIASGRVPDFALIAGGGDQNTRAGVEPLNGQWMAITNQHNLSLFLNRVLTDPGLAGTYQGMVQGKISNAVQMQVATSRQWVPAMGALAGMTQQIINQNNFNAAEKAAAFKATVQEFASLMLPPVMMIPTPTPQVGSIIADLVKPIIFGPVIGKLGILEGSTVAGDNIVAGGDPAKQLQLGDQAFVSDKTAMHLAVIQGLVKAGLLKPEPSFYRNGHVIDSSYIPVLMTSGKTYNGMTISGWAQEAINGVELHQ